MEPNYLEEPFVIVCEVILILFLIVPSAAFAFDTRASLIRAAISLQIARFVDWPEILGSTENLQFCVFGDSNFFKAVSEVSVGKLVKGKVINPVEINSLASISRCDFVVVPSEEQDKFQVDIHGKSNPVFFICNGENLGWKGCNAHIFEEGNRARVAIDLTRSGSFNISSELLALSVIKKN